MLSKIDRWLVDDVFQRIVDWSQRDSVWWIRQTAIASAIYNIICIVVKSMGIEVGGMYSLPNLFFNVLVSIWIIYWGRDRVRVVSLGTITWFRIFLLVFSAIITLFVDLPRHPTNIPITIIFTGFYYFAATRPPKPRQRQTKPKLAFNS